jgi:hypothetical protein
MRRLSTKKGRKSSNLGVLLGEKGGGRARRSFGYSE